MKLRLEQFTSATSPDPDCTGSSGRGGLAEANSPHSSDTEAEAAAKLVHSKEVELSAPVSANLLGTSPSSVNLSVNDLSKRLHEERSAKGEIEKELEMTVRFCLENILSYFPIS